MAGVGSVDTRAWALLLEAGDRIKPLFPQGKEAGRDPSGVDLREQSRGGLLSGGSQFEVVDGADHQDIDVAGGGPGSRAR